MINTSSGMGTLRIMQLFPVKFPKYFSKNKKAPYHCALFQRFLWYFPHYTASSILRGSKYRLPRLGTPKLNRSRHVFVSCTQFEHTIMPHLEHQVYHSICSGSALQLGQLVTLKILICDLSSISTIGAFNAAENTAFFKCMNS